MNKTVIAAAALLISLPLSGQNWHFSEQNPSMIKFNTDDSRKEIMTPVVNGYNVIKADLHVHTIFSDGGVAPEYRIREAWADGLDAIAITDHMEYRPIEKRMLKFMGSGVTKNEVEKDKILSDLNYSVAQAEKLAEYRGITLIRGAEITRNPEKYGHFNVLFTTDNNAIYDPDPLVAIRNARKQDAIIQCNHPGWRRTDNEFTPVMEAALKEGLIDGVEIFNTEEFYPNVIEKAVERGLFVAGGTDIHSESSLDYAREGVFRDMTLIFAKDASAESLREALKSGRTLSYGHGHIAGSEQLLTDFFRAAVNVQLMNVGSTGLKRFKITNTCSFPMTVILPGWQDAYVLKPFTSVRYSTEEQQFGIKVMNMWCGTDRHPEIIY